MCAVVLLTILGMAKAEATITKIAQNNNRPRGTIASILTTFQLQGNVEIDTTPRAH